MKNKIKNLDMLEENTNKKGMPDEWFEEFNQNCEKFKWFIEMYFGEDHFKYLKKLSLEKNTRLFSELNNIWFELPSSKFNIIDNPVGWSEFLSLVEV